MCGICGRLALADGQTVNPRLASDMANAMHHRGPDDYGVYVGSGIALGHRRLSIIDLHAGKQPLSNEDETVWTVFNGEIYNFKELRADLRRRGHVFKTSTDTEVIVHLYEEYGERCVEHLRGMFAMAVWDVHTRTLLLARDRLGIKPLYYMESSSYLTFASEIKALLVDRSVSRQVAVEAFSHFLACGYTPGHKTMLDGVLKLEPGHMMVVKNGQIVSRRYWDLRFGHPQRRLTVRQASDELNSLLRDTVHLHMISDVQIGVLLSGGVDSTAIASLVHEQAQERLQTFTIGFGGQEFADERMYARVAANELGSKHHETTITSDDFRDFLPQFVWHMEEPVCEPPAVALYYVTKLAGEAGVKVLMSGEGGDEAFAGYQNYRNLLWLERMKSYGGVLARSFGPALEVMSRRAGLSKLARYARLMNMPFDEYYWGRTATGFSAFSAPDFLRSEALLKWSKRNVTAAYFKRLCRSVEHESILHRMLYADSKTWLPDDLLIKADKITMANSVELRVPLLDHKLVEFAAALPANYKVRGLNTKYILKAALKRRIPQSILRRRKAGFPIPIGSWLQNELRDLARDIVLDRRAMERGYFERKAVEALFADVRSNVAEIFSLVVLELWHRQFIDHSDITQKLAV